MQYNKKNISMKAFMPDDDLAAAKALIQNNPLRVQALPDKTVIDFYMPKEITDCSEDYIDFFRALADARTTDEVNLHINCYGGECSTAFQIIDNLQASQASINIIVEGDCCSAATMIMLAGDNWDIMPHAYAMLHAYSSIEYGKRQELKASEKFREKWLDASIREIYKGFLTDEELDLMMQGQDYYFTASEIIDRLNRFKKDEIERQEVINKVVEKHQKIINDDLQKVLEDFDKKHAEKPVKKSSKRSTTK